MHVDTTNPYDDKTIKVAYENFVNESSSNQNSGSDDSGELTIFSFHSYYYIYHQ